MSTATLLLTAVEQGDPKAADALLELVYQDLRRLATHKMAQESPGQTLQPTALVHEAWLRLVGSENPNFENRAHFFSAAAEAMSHDGLAELRDHADLGPVVAPERRLALLELPVLDVPGVSPGPLLDDPADRDDGEAGRDEDQQRGHRERCYPHAP